MKTCIIVVHIGKFKQDFELWLVSAMHNPDFDFLIFTNDELGIQKYSNLSKNIIFHSISLAEIQTRIKSKLLIYPELTNPYKLCDFKPSYGVIFDEYINNYDYWGYCDTDLIFGDLKSLIGKKLGIYDRILDLGHLCLFKNTKKNNYLFTSKEKRPHLTFEMACKESENIYFDEYFGLNVIWDCHEELSQYKDRCIYCDTNIYSFSLSNLNTSKTKIFAFWKEGKLYEISKKGKREILYIHLQKRKMKLPNSSNNLLEIKSLAIVNDSFLLITEEQAFKVYNKAHPLKSILYYLSKKISYYKIRFKRKKYIKKEAKTDFYKICY